MRPHPTLRAEPPAPARPAAAPSAPPQPAGRRDPTDYSGWYVSSLELRQGLSVVDLDDPDLHRLFG